MSKLKMRQTPDTKQNHTDYARESSGTSDPGRTSHTTKHDDQIKQSTCLYLTQVLANVKVRLKQLKLRLAETHSRSGATRKDALFT